MAAKNTNAESPAIAEVPTRVMVSRYTVDELAAANGKFNVPMECVYAAFRVADKKEASVQEAAEIIDTQT
jgi:hypothetical protein